MRLRREDTHAAGPVGLAIHQSAPRPQPLSVDRQLAKAMSLALLHKKRPCGLGASSDGNRGSLWAPGGGSASRYLFPRARFWLVGTNKALVEWRSLAEIPELRDMARLLMGNVVSHCGGSIRVAHCRSGVDKYLRGSRPHRRVTPQA